MNVVMLSSYYNHHQETLSQALSAVCDSYHFVETKEISEERKNLGWGLDKKPDYVVSYDYSKENPDKIQELINGADVVIFGSAPEKLIKSRIKNRKVIFRYYERPLKKGSSIIKFIPRLATWRIKTIDRKNIYMLCASAYTCADYAKFGLFKNKCYKWGYFPEVVKYKDIDELIGQKKKNSILWVARMIDWKHPEIAVEIAKRLKADGYDFVLNMIGNGVLEEDIKELISNEGLSDCVRMLGSMKPEEVREHMETSEIFLFTSDRNEGWGAVLNESMNSACAVVASHAIGSVPFMIKDTENGLIYKDGDVDDLCRKTKWLLDHPEERRNISSKAYGTLINEWNAENAARKFVVLAEKILNGEDKPDIYEKGVCSRAKILKDDWYR